MKTLSLILFCLLVGQTSDSPKRETYVGDFCGLIKIELFPNGEYSLTHRLEHLGSLNSVGGYRKNDSLIILFEDRQTIRDDTFNIGDRTIIQEVPDWYDTTTTYDYFKKVELEIVNDTIIRTQDFYCGAVTVRQPIYYTTLTKRK